MDDAINAIHLSTVFVDLSNGIAVTSEIEHDKNDCITELDRQMQLLNQIEGANKSFDEKSDRLAKLENDIIELQNQVKDKCYPYITASKTLNNNLKTKKFQNINNQIENELITKLNQHKEINESNLKQFVIKSKENKKQKQTINKLFEKQSQIETQLEESREKHSKKLKEKQTLKRDIQIQNNTIGRKQNEIRQICVKYFL